MLDDGAQALEDEARRNDQLQAEWREVRGMSLYPLLFESADHEEEKATEALILSTSPAIDEQCRKIILRARAVREWAEMMDAICDDVPEESIPDFFHTNEEYQ